MRRPRFRKGRSALAVAAAGTLLSTAFVWLSSELRIERRYEAKALPPVSAVTGVIAARGQHLVLAVTQCTLCHGEDLGGAPLVDDVLIGRLYAPNLTRGRGGLAGRLDAAALAPALRRGVRRDGRSLWLMPTAGLSQLTDAELDEIATYLNAAAPVDRETPERRAGPLSRLALALGRAPDLLSAEWTPDRAAAASPNSALSPADEDGQGANESRVRRGAHLVEVASCRVCHRPDLRGGLHPLSLPDEPPPPDLTASGAIARWSEADFRTAMREGRRPDGALLDPEYMPWRGFARMSDRELGDIWAYLLTLRGNS